MPIVILGILGGIGLWIAWWRFVVAFDKALDKDRKEEV